MPASSIIRSDDLRSENRRRLLNTLRAEGPSTPARLGTLTGLSAASISTLSSQMIEQGILISNRYRTDQNKPMRGRPRSLLSFSPDAGHVLALTLTIDQVRTQLVNYAGNHCDTHQQILDTRILSKDQLLPTIYQSLDEMRTRHPDILLRHIGVGFQGQTEHATGMLLWSPVIRERNVPLGDALHRRYGVSVSVSVNNDCCLISHALSRRQADVLRDTFATVLLGYGVGLGLYLNGQPFAGTRSSAMEMGHMRFEHNGALCRCGKRGCIEAYAADYGIERLARGWPIETPPEGRVAESALQTLLFEAESGQQAARHAFHIAGTAIGEGLINLFTLLDPMPVALVGCSDRMFAAMRAGICGVLDAHLPNGSDASNWLHCFAHDDPLLCQGLIDNSLTVVDRQLAALNSVVAAV